MKAKTKYRGSALALALIMIVIMTIAGLAVLKVAEGSLIGAVRIKNEAGAGSAAEAAYEKAVFWMSQQVDMLDAMDTSGISGSLAFAQSRADYNISFASFLGSRPVFKVEANGYSGIYQKTIDAYMVQAISGWEMGMCRVPSGPSSTSKVSFMTGEIIDVSLHINNLKDNPDARDIYISGSPSFLEHVSVSESRYTPGGTDKYASVNSLFQEGVSFNQPASRIADRTSVATKVTRFRDSTASAYRFTPKANSGISGGIPAVQLEFYVGNDGQGYVRITEDCTVVGYQRSGVSSNSWDYKIDPAGNGTTYTKYPVYGYHYIPGNAAKRYVRRIDNPSDSIYVTQSYGGVDGEPGAQIFVNGNVVIGSKGENASSFSELNSVKGRISVVATGNIWVANELKVSGARSGDGMPVDENPNVVGLISQGVTKVVDPGMTNNGLLSTPPTSKSGDYYEPIGNKDRVKKSPIYGRELPGTMVVEAAVTVGGGGWGAENVYRSDASTDRKNYNGSSSDNLIVRGSITEVTRGVVGCNISSTNKNGYSKMYYFDKRLMRGILPGNVWLKGKYVLIPGGWSESSSVNTN